MLLLRQLVSRVLNSLFLKMLKTEKAELLNAFFASVFNSETSCSLGTQPHELEDRDRE